MGDRSAIEWTEATWNPIRGCSRVSEGCRHCYAEAVASRFSGEGMPYEGLAKGGKWTGELRLVPEALSLPIRWNRPRRIFVNSMSDLFHEKVPDAWIDAILGVMMLASHHSFQVLTKRPERMLRYLSESLKWRDLMWRPMEALKQLDPRWPTLRIGKGGHMKAWPSPHIWWGVSVENEETAHDRIPLLLQTPAAVRWVSYEPALAAIDRWYTRLPNGDTIDWLTGMVRPNAPLHADPPYDGGRRIDWIVVGGESGPGARPFDLAWARQTITQGRAGRVPVFVKQLGARPLYRWEHDDLTHSLLLHDRKGGDPKEWPDDLRVREYPRGAV